MHADPHPGNFLFSNDKVLGILDFGCVKRFDDLFLVHLRKIFNALIKNFQGENSAGVLSVYQESGILSEDISVQIYKTKISPTLKPLQFWLVEPFLMEEFDFSNKSVFPSKSNDEFIKVAPYLSNFHRDQTYFNRLYIGIMSLVKQMGAVVKTVNPWIG